MNTQHCTSSIHLICDFLITTRLNWRNTLYIECARCKRGGCTFESLLFVPREDGLPLLFPVSDAQILFGRQIDKSECLGEMSCLRFEALFSCWLAADPCRDNTCPMRNKIFSYGEHWKEQDISARCPKKHQNAWIKIYSPCEPTRIMLERSP